MVAVGDGHCRGGDGELAIWLVVGMRSSPAVPQLTEKDGFFVVHGLNNGFPAFYLVLGVDARGAGIAVALGGDDGALGDKERAGSGAF